jgi:hypothetical protein
VSRLGERVQHPLLAGLRAIGQLGHARGGIEAGGVQQRADRHARLEAAPAAAGAQLALGIDRRVAELAAEPVGAAEQLAADDDPRADPELPRDVDEVAQLAARPLPELGQPAEVRLVLRLDGEARAAEPGGQQLRHRDAGPAEVRRDQQPAVASHETRHREDGTDREQLLIAHGRERVLDQPDEIVEHVVHRPPAVVDGLERAVALVAGEIRRANGKEVDTELQAEADHAAAAELDRQRRPADRAAQLDLGLPHQAELDELPDEARHGGLVQSGLLSDRGPRARAVLGDVPQHDAEVVAPHGTLVRRGATGVVRGHRRTLTAAAVGGDGCPHANRSGQEPRQRPLAGVERRGCGDQLDRLGLREPRGPLQPRVGREPVHIGGDLEPLRRVVPRLAVGVEQHEEPAGLVTLLPVVCPDDARDRLALVDEQLAGAVGVVDSVEARHRRSYTTVGFTRPPPWNATGGAGAA